MKLWIVVLTCLSLPAFADSDPWGNAYPAQCADVSDVSLPVIEVDNLPVKLGTASRCGVWVSRPQGNMVYLLSSCPKPRAEVLRHELCHEKMWRLTGDPHWH